jgi:hypothetical protein
MTWGFLMALTNGDLTKGINLTDIYVAQKKRPYVHTWTIDVLFHTLLHCPVSICLSSHTFRKCAYIPYIALLYALMFVCILFFRKQYIQQILLCDCSILHIMYFSIIFGKQFNLFFFQGTFSLIIEVLQYRGTNKDAESVNGKSLPFQ